MITDTLADFYQINDTDQPIKLKVDVCFGQNSVSKILLNNQIISGPESDGCFVRSFEKILGTNKELEGKKLQMTTLVLNKDKNPDGTMLIISLTGGITQYAQKLETYPAENGGVEKYSIRIRFCK